MDNNTTFTLTSNARMGWECPKCGACHSPTVETCQRCAPPYNAQPYQPYFPSPYEYPTTAPYPWWGIYPPFDPYYTTCDMREYTTTSDTVEID